MSTRRFQKEKPFNGFLLLLLAFFVVFLYVWLQITSTRMVYKVDNLRVALDREIEVNKQLKISISELSSPQKLDRIAKKMKLQNPSKGQVVEIPAE